MIDEQSSRLDVWGSRLAEGGLGGAGLISIGGGLMACGIGESGGEKPGGACSGLTAGDAMLTAGDAMLTAGVIGESMKPGGGVSITSFGDDDMRGDVRTGDTGTQDMDISRRSRCGRANLFTLGVAVTRRGLRRII